MRITKSAYDAALEKSMKEINSDEQKREYILAHDGCDKCPCCGKPNPSFGENQQRQDFKQRHGLFTTYGKIDSYWCEECGSKWESDPFAKKDFIADWVLTIFYIIFFLFIIGLEIGIIFFLGVYCNVILAIILSIGSVLIIASILIMIGEKCTTLSYESCDYCNLLYDYPRIGFHSIVENKK